MKVILNNEKVKELAQELANGFHVYINTDTGETKAVYDYGNHMNENGFWNEEKREVGLNWDQFEKIEPPKSMDSLEFKENFLKQVDDEMLKRKLQKALMQKVSFETFEDIVEDSPLNEEWIDHLHQSYYNYLITNLYNRNIGVD